MPGLIDLPELQYTRFMDFETMGITYHKKLYEFEPNWILAHGDEGNINPNAGVTALNLAKKIGKSVICGHTHRLGMSAFSEGIGSHYRPLYGIEVGNLMAKGKAAYLRSGVANWQMGIAILETNGKQITPTLIPINKDGSFVACGKLYA